MQTHAVSQPAVTSPPPPSLLRISDVQRRTGLSRGTIYRLVAAGEFPRQIRLTEATTAWIESEVTFWIESRIAASKAAQ